MHVIEVYIYLIVKQMYYAGNLSHIKSQTGDKIESNIQQLNINNKLKQRGYLLLLRR